MAEKLTLTRYLQGRGEVKALTHIEALAFGVPYPLQPGWPRKYGDLEITDPMIDDLKNRIATAKESTASKARRGLDGIGQTAPVPSVDAHNELRAAGYAVSSLGSSSVGLELFPGFAVRRAQRYVRRRPVRPV